MSDAAIQIDDPLLQHELAFISGIASDGTVANNSYWADKENDALAHPHKFGATQASTAGGTVTYTFDAPGHGSDPAWNATEKSYFEAGFALWSAVANIHFVQADDPATAMIAIQRGTDDKAHTDVVEHNVPIGSSTIPNPVSGYVVSIDTNTSSFGPISDLATHGGYPVETVVHELGHVLGLGHGGNYNGDNSGPAEHQETAYDSRQYSLMSYINPGDTKDRYFSENPVPGTDWSTGPGKHAYPTTPMMLDILAAQRLYGAPTDTPLSGGQCFGFNCNVQGSIAQFFDFSENKTPVITIWDAGTGNTLDLSQFSAASVVSLKPGSFTSCDGLTNNIGIAFDTSVTTAVGGSGNDFFYVDGSEGTQTLIGGAGVNAVGVDDAFGAGRIVVDVADGSVMRGDLLDATLQQIQIVTLGANDATVLGAASGADEVFGGSGALEVYNQGGTDYILGGTGQNSIVGGSGATIFYSAGGNDVMQGGTGDSFMQAGDTTASQDVFYGGGGKDYVYGGAGNTTLIGGSGTELLTAGSGTNTLIGSSTQAGFDILQGGSGTDVFYGGVGTNLMYEGSGRDTFVGGSGTDYIYGGKGESYVYGGAGVTVVTTGAGDQYVKAGTGYTVFNDTAENMTAGRSDFIDNFSGGQGTDLYLPTAAAATTTFEAANGGTAILTAVSGGTSGLFAANVDVATVQAHTHFTL